MLFPSIRRVYICSFASLILNFRFFLQFVIILLHRVLVSISQTIFESFSPSVCWYFFFLSRVKIDSYIQWFLLTTKHKKRTVLMCFFGKARIKFIAPYKTPFSFFFCFRNTLGRKFSTNNILGAMEGERERARLNF
uniref:Uncharacterized protein n=1 Tax=Anopheles atroparvus TaxID=41427 RepID=A0AAG5DMU3_ANOAO